MTHSDHELGGLEFPEGDIDGDTTLTLGLELVKNPGCAKKKKKMSGIGRQENFFIHTILEGTLSEFSSLLLELLDGTLVDTTALVDQVTSGGGLAGIDVADDWG